MASCSGSAASARPVFQSTTWNRASRDSGGLLVDRVDPTADQPTSIEMLNGASIAYGTRAAEPTGGERLAELAQLLLVVGPEVGPIGQVVGIDQLLLTEAPFGSRESK